MGSHVVDVRGSVHFRGINIGGGEELVHEVGVLDTAASNKGDLGSSISGPFVDGLSLKGVSVSMIKDSVTSLSGVELFDGGFKVHESHGLRLQHLLVNSVVELRSWSISNRSNISDVSVNNLSVVNGGEIFVDSLFVDLGTNNL